jgi:hypothetical protein
MFDCRKDMFYRILSNDRIDWRHILRYVNKKLMNAICVRSDARNSEYPVCLEVCFHECKSLLNLGKCQCRDFGSQIASISLVMLQYNLLSCVKRFESYETIGGLFREITAKTVELSITEKIWGLIQEIVSVIADYFSADSDELMTNIINQNKQLKAMMDVVQRSRLCF